MAIIKCKMCGGDLVLTEGATVAVCEYCGTRQTVPSADSEKKLTLFARANRLRLACEFDKAAGVYESIVAEFPEEAEAYWGLVLCRYGIEYVDDPATGNKIPTCHRSSFDSVLEDGDFEQACENADGLARKVYREEAKAIEDLRKGILEVSGKEEPYDIFICYKETDENGQRTIDSVIAQDVYDALTEKGYRVFFSRITLEDKLGTEYEPYIFAALNSAKVMLVFGTDYEYFNAVWVKNEWSRFLALIAAGQKKTLIPCYKNVDAYDMPREFAKLQAQDMGKVGAMQDLLRGVGKILGEGKPAQTAAAVSGPNVESILKRGSMALEDKDWGKAKSFFDQVLNIDAECSDAYLGIMMANTNCPDRPSFEQYFVGCDELPDQANYQRALKYGDGARQEFLKKLEQDRQARLAHLAQERAERTRQAARARAVARRASGMIAAGDHHVVGLRLDGTVVATGDNSEGQCDVSGWQDIVMVSAGRDHTVGLKADGTVVAVGGNSWGQCEVSGWRHIAAISAGCYHTLGLRWDGTVAIAGAFTTFGSPDRDFVRSWRNVATLATYGIAAITKDGRVLTRVSELNETVAGWKDVTSYAESYYHALCYHSNGSISATVRKTADKGQANISSWKTASPITAVTAGEDHSVCLRADGTVGACGLNVYGQCDVSSWRDVVAIATGYNITMGLRADGTVVVVGDYGKGQCNVSDWRLFQDFRELEPLPPAPRPATREEAKKDIIKELGALLDRRKALREEKKRLGLFGGDRRKIIAAQIEDLQNDIICQNFDREQDINNSGLLD